MNDNKWRDTFIRAAIQDDPASFRHQLAQAHLAIGELLAMYDSIKRDVADALTYMDAGHYDEASEVLTKWAS